jgi:hypothetical protein
VIAVDQSFAVGQNRIRILHDRVGRQSAVALRQVHRAARQHHTDAEAPRRRDLDVDCGFKSSRKHVMMVGGGAATRQQQFGHRHGNGEFKRLGREPGPDRVERLQPGKQLAVERRRRGAGQRLVEMMMGVDQSRHDDVAAGLENCSVRRGGGSSGRNQFDNAAVLDDHAPLGAVRQDGQRVLDPQRRLVAHRRLLIGQNLLPAIALYRLYLQF